MTDSRVPFRATAASAPYDLVGRLPVSVLLDNVRSTYNVGAFFRTADAAGVEALVLSGITARPPHRGIAKTALGAEERVAWRSESDVRACIADMRGRGVEIAVIETAPAAVDLFDWRPAFPVCVVFGHEVDGVGHDIIDAADTLVCLPMRGTKRSLNVATAGGIVLYELLRKYRALGTR